MLGWLIIVHTGSFDSEATDNDVLARWETGISGIDWLDALEREDKARCVSRHGYPTRFLVGAQHVLPYLRSGQPPLHDGPEIIGDDYVMPRGWSGPMMVRNQRLLSCDVTELWTVDAWDQS